MGGGQADGHRAAVQGEDVRTAAAPEAAARLRMIVGRLGRRLGASGAGGGMTPSQLSVLGTVARLGPLRLSDLAVREGINPTMLSRIVGKLDDAGLIVRRVDDRDRRSVHVEVTVAGRREHDSIVARRTQALAAGLGRLSDQDRASVLAALPALERLVQELSRTPVIVPMGASADAQL